MITHSVLSHSISKTAARSATGLLLALCATSCVSQQRFDEEAANSRYWHANYLDSAAAYEQLSTEARALREGGGSLAAGTTSAAAPVDPDIDERMARLDELARRLGRTPGDVTTLVVEGGYGFSLADSVVFDSGSSDLRTEGQAVLSELARDIAGSPFEVLWVRGHSDNVPMRRDATLQRFPFGNMHLSVVRALAVRQWLVDNCNLSPDKLFVAGFGPYLPVADNATAEGQQKNRRVEIVVLETEGARQP